MNDNDDRAAGGKADVVPAATASRMRELGISLAFAAQMRAAARLGIADALGDQPRPAAELAAAIDADPDTLDRLLRALTSHGVFVETAPGHYAHTDLSQLLREDHPASLKYLMLWFTAPWTWQVWPRLDEAVRTGKPAFTEIYGADFFAYLRSDPESAEVFHRAMTEASRISSDRVVDVLDVTDVRTVVDVGGGQGHLVATLLRRYPQVRAVLYDLATVVAGALAEIREGGELADRCQVVAGDCRVDVPAGADLYLFKNVLEWDDESTLAALRAVRRCGQPGGRVVLVQNLVEDTPELTVTTAMDLFMLLNVGGKKHTRRGLAQLLEAAGLRPDGVEPVPGTTLRAVTAHIPAVGA